MQDETCSSMLVCCAGHGDEDHHKQYRSAAQKPICAVRGKRFDWALKMDVEGRSRMGGDRGEVENGDRIVGKVRKLELRRPVGLGRDGESSC